MPRDDNQPPLEAWTLICIFPFTRTHLNTPTTTSSLTRPALIKLALNFRLYQLCIELLKGRPGYAITLTHVQTPKLRLSVSVYPGTLHELYGVKNAVPVLFFDISASRIFATCTIFADVEQPSIPTFHFISLPYKGGRFSLLCCGISVLPFPNISTSCTEIRIKPKDIPTGTSGPEAEYQIIYELHLRRFSCRSSNIFDFIRPPSSVKSKN